MGWPHEAEGTLPSVGWLIFFRCQVPGLCVCHSQDGATTSHLSRASFALVTLGWHSSVWPSTECWPDARRVAAFTKPLVTQRQA